MIPIYKSGKNKGKPYKLPKISNKRESVIAQEYYNNGFVVLNKGWPDFFCYNPETKQIELVEVKSLKVRKTKKSKKIGLTQDQIKMHQYLKKAGFKVKIIQI